MKVNFYVLPPKLQNNYKTVQCISEGKFVVETPDVKN